MNRTFVMKKNLIRRILLTVILLLSVFNFQDALASDHPILYLFWGEGCPHCAEEKEFLKLLYQQYPELEMRWFEIWDHPEFAKLADTMRENYGEKMTLVPMTFIGDRIIIGFRSYEETGVQIEEQVKACIQQGCSDALDKIKSQRIVIKIRDEAARNESEGWDLYPPLASLELYSGQSHIQQSEKIVVYYFHGTYRCPSCTTIEQYTRETVEEVFANELQSGRVELKIVNAESPENRHFIKDYQLYTKSVIVSDVVDGKEIRWKNLQKVWELLRNQKAFKEYVKTEIKAYLQEKQS